MTISFSSDSSDIVEADKTGQSQVMDSASTPLNHIEEYVKENIKDDNFKDLFEATSENVDLRTDLSSDELVIINKVKINNLFLLDKIGFDIYSSFVESYLRLKISYDRKSRSEFVDINRKDRFEQNLQRFGNFQNLTKVKE